MPNRICLLSGANVKSDAALIYTSRVNDGVCDCCDGSDEWGAEQRAAWLKNNEITVGEITPQMQVYKGHLLNFRYFRIQWAQLSDKCHTLVYLEH